MVPFGRHLKDLHGGRLPWGFQVKMVPFGRPVKVLHIGRLSCRIPDGEFLRVDSPASVFPEDKMRSSSKKTPVDMWRAYGVLVGCHMNAWSI